MKYMVVLHRGRQEDQELTGLILHLYADAGLTTADILAKFVEDFKGAIKSPVVLTCLNEKCGYYRIAAAGIYCRECGKELKKTEARISRDYLQRQINALFNSTLDGLSEDVISEMEERGWRFWDSYKSDAYAFISGISEYVENPDSWLPYAHEFSKLET